LPNFTSLLTVLTVLSLGFSPVAGAADSETAYVVSYFETGFADKDQASALARKLSDASGKEDGNLRFEVLQRIGQPDQFVILEAWKDKTAGAAHVAAGHTREFREKIRPILRGAYDERPHSALSVSNVQVPATKSRGAIFGVTHVDIVPMEKERGVNLVKEMAGNSRSDTGNIRFEALTQNSRPNHMTVVEIWMDRAASDANESTPHKIKFRETLTPMSGSLYDERFYRQIN